MDIEIPPPDLASPHIPTLESLYYCQVEQLVERFPLWAVWIVYQPEHQPKQRIFAKAAEFSQAQEPLKRYLESEAWLQDSPSSQPNTLTLEASTAYIYALTGNIPEAGAQSPVPASSSQDVPPDYLLIWARETLSLAQRHAIEQQVQMLRHLLSLNQRCSHQQREIDLLEQIVRRVGHQLGNPLALIRLCAETLHLGLPTSLREEQVTLICETTERMKTYLSDLIQCGRRSSLYLAPHNLQEILAESLQELRPWITEKELQQNFSTTFVTVNVDRFQLKQVFDNLLSNAIAFSPLGSTLTCHWQVFANEVLVQIRDQGPGLSEADLKQVFTPFYSRRPGGKGLGLAIAQKIILDHQGRLWAETLPTGGAQFSFTLPRSRSDP